jgi:hypothetical protein
MTSVSIELFILRTFVKPRRTGLEHAFNIDLSPGGEIVAIERAAQRELGRRKTITGQLDEYTLYIRPGRSPRTIGIVPGGCVRDGPVIDIDKIVVSGDDGVIAMAPDIRPIHSADIVAGAHEKADRPRQTVHARSRQSLDLGI